MVVPCSYLHEEGTGLDIDLVLRIAGIGIITVVVTTVLEQAGKKDYAWMVTAVGVLISMGLVIKLVAQLLDDVKAVFQLW